MPPKFKNITFNFVPVNTKQSLEPLEARRRALDLYKAWYRQMPVILYDYKIPVSPEEGRSKLREIFVRNSRLTDVKRINQLILKGQMELNESVNKQKEDCHLWKYLRAPPKRSQDFLSRFEESN